MKDLIAVLRALPFLMLAFPSAIKIYVAVQPLDMRKSFNGLWSAVSEHLQEDPKSGSLLFYAPLKLFFTAEKLKIRIEHSLLNHPFIGQIVQLLQEQ